MNFDLLEWVERLGGWAVVIWIVHAMMKRSDRAIDALVNAVDAFDSYRSEAVSHHEEVTRELRALREAVNTHGTG